MSLHHIKSCIARISLGGRLDWNTSYNHITSYMCVWKKRSKRQSWFFRMREKSDFFYMDRICLFDGIGMNLGWAWLGYTLSLL